MVRDHLSQELIEAGRQLLLATDGLNLQAQGAMWVYSHELGDWRYYLVTSLARIIQPIDPLVAQTVVLA